MILLDTNIVSEVMRPGPDPRVLRWLDDQESNSLFLSSISVAEIAFGIRILADGKRRNSLVERFDHFISTGFEFRILPFDTAAAYLFAELMGRRRELGRPMSFPDGQIASISGPALSESGQKDRGPQGRPPTPHTVISTTSHAVHPTGVEGSLHSVASLPPWG